MNLTFSDFLPLMPLIIVTSTVVLAMAAIGIRRSYILTVGVTVIGLLLAAIVAAVIMPYTNKQVSPLMIIDQYSLFFTVIICVAAMFIAIFSFNYLADLDDQKEEYYLLLGIATVGSVVMVSTNHFVGMVLGLETLSMSLYGMIAYTVRCKNSAKYVLEASVKYLVLSATASGFMLFGMALIYAQTGTLAFSSLLDTRLVISDTYTIAAVSLISAGIAFKLSLAPFHIWTPDVYEGSPIPSTTYLATIGKAAMFVVLLRFVEISGALTFKSVVAVFSIIAVISIMAGNLLALMQDNLKRILAYSSIAHMGYLLIAVIASFFAVGTVSIEAVTFYLLAYVIMSLGAFGVLSIFSSSQNELDSIADYQGLFWRSPWLAAVFTGMLLSLAGIPLTVGFIGKFYVFLAGVETELWILLSVLIVGSGIGLYYYLRIVYRMLMPVSGDNILVDTRMENLSTLGVLAILFVLLLALGIYPAPIMAIIEAISVHI
ncbi:MAG: NADH-quinone oxidoreductase subunit N [Pseudomonadales bacterium]|nr:NADH-quinone oxidoreductase subunit N [Pseudomonadales bacterium]HAD72255.1 NADH-quinone oxidoreductase subunit N [Gammaproteobacteria bacterium]